MEQEVEVWIARDMSGEILVYDKKPVKHDSYWNTNSKKKNHLTNYLILKRESFQNIKWEDNEPTKAKITLVK